MEKQQLIDQYIKRIEDALECAASNTTKLTDKQFGIDGMSSRKNRILLNELVKTETNYLEIGINRGSTFISALHQNNPKSAIAIDNASMDTMNIFINNCTDNEIQNYHFINRDCFDLTEEDRNSIKNIDVYFYDGEHREEDQYKAIDYYYDNLEDVFIFIVDDWNHEPAKIGTRNVIKDRNIKVHKEWELPASHNGDTEQWWNGLFVGVCEK